MSPTSSTEKPLECLLVGSVPLASSEEVMRRCAGVLSGVTNQFPDGEVGERSNWIFWQNEVFQKNEQFVDASPIEGMYQAGIRPGHSGPIVFEDLGYAQAATESYSTFCKLRDEGVMPKDARFQVSLPTPLAVVTFYTVLDDRARIEEAYATALINEAKRIFADIPHDDLALQWDVAVEVAILEQAMPTHLASPYEDILERLCQLIALTPVDVRMGVHLCYGDAGHQHFKEPDDLALVVRLANSIADRTKRPIHWVHMPVPISRSDDDYFQPLENLAIDNNTRLFLGLVHEQDGVDGAKTRIAAARKHYPRFGIATECGMGRRDPALIPGLLKLHREVAGAT
jgi:hypothetical protein